MPRKTRQEKIITELRRKLKTAQERDSVQPVIFSPQKQTKNVSQIPAGRLSSITEKVKIPEIGTLNYIKSDMRKTGILTFFAIALEFMLYLILEKGYLTRFLK